MPHLSLVQRLSREKNLHRYLTALEEGDFDTAAALLAQAAHDTVLAQMIFEFHESDQADETHFAMTDEDDVMDNNIGTVRSQPTREQSAEVKREPRKGRGALWIQALAAVLLVCILGGGFLAIQTWRSSSTKTATPGHPGWCVVPGAALDTQLGTATFNAVAAASTSHAWIVGTYDHQTLVEHWDGTHWMHDTTPNPDPHGNVLNAVAAVSTNDVWAVGSTFTLENENSVSVPTNTLIEHWDGKLWSVVPGSDLQNGHNTLFGVAAVSANDIWAVGQTNQSSLIEHWDGARWNMVSVPTSFKSGALYAITALSPNDIWTVGVSGSKPVIVHWNGDQWSPVALPKIALDVHTSGSITTISGAMGYSISASSAQDIWAVDPWAGQSMLHWDGKLWRVIANPALKSADDGIKAVLALTPNDAWAVGGSGNPSTGATPLLIIEHWDGQHWKSMPGSQAGIFASLTTAGGKIWSVGTSYTNGYQQTPGTLIASNTCQ